MNNIIALNFDKHFTIAHSYKELQDLGYQSTSNKLIYSNIENSIRLFHPTLIRILN